MAPIERTLELSHELIRLLIIQPINHCEAGMSSMIGVFVEIVGTVTVSSVRTGRAE